MEIANPRPAGFQRRLAIGMVSKDILCPTG